MSPNLYVILTTTDIGDLSQPLKSRARIFHFGRLNKNNTMLLLNNLCKQQGVSLDMQIKDLLCDYSKGVARDLISLFDFVTKNKISLYELQNYLNAIGNEEFINLFVCASANNMAEYVNALHELLSENGIDVVVPQLKRFFLNVVFCLEGGIKENFTKSENKILIDLLSGKPIYKIARIIDKLSRHSQEEDFFFAFLSIWEIMHNSSVKEAIVSPKEEIRLQKKASDDSLKENKLITKQELTKVEKMTENDFLNYMSAFD